MRIRFSIRDLLWLMLAVAAFEVVAIRGVSSAAEGQDGDVKQKLIRLWEENRAAFSRCHLRYKIISRRANGQVAKKEVEGLLSKLPKNYLNHSDQDAIHDLAELFKLGIDKGKPVWGTLELWLDGKQARQEDWYDGKLMHVLIRNGSADAYLQARNNQLDLYKLGECRMKLHSPVDFAPIPKIATDTSIEILGNQELPTVEARINGTTYHVDRSSGFVHKLIRERKNEVYEIIAVDGAAKSGKVQFPHTSIELTFRNNFLAKVQMVVFEEASFNEPIPEEKFKIGIDSPTKVFDYRQDASKAKFAGFLEPTPDVIAEVDK